MPRGPSVVLTMSATARHASMLERVCAFPCDASVPSRRRMICGCWSGPSHRHPRPRSMGRHSNPGRNDVHRSNRVIATIRFDTNAHVRVRYLVSSPSPRCDHPRPRRRVASPPSLPWIHHVAFHVFLHHVPSWRACLATPWRLERRRMASIGSSRWKWRRLGPHPASQSQIEPSRIPFKAQVDRR